MVVKVAQAEEEDRLTAIHQQRKNDDVPICIYCSPFSAPPVGGDCSAEDGKSERREEVKRDSILGQWQGSPGQSPWNVDLIEEGRCNV